MKHYLKSNPSGGLLILINEKEKPEITTKSPNPFYEASLEKWLSDCQTIPVAKESEDKFWNLGTTLLEADGVDYNTRLNEGILIPKENVKLKVICKNEICAGECVNCDSGSINASFVPSKEAEKPKEEGFGSYMQRVLPTLINDKDFFKEAEGNKTQEQVELWKTVFDFFELNYFETEDYIINKLKSKFHITRIK